MNVSVRGASRQIARHPRKEQAPTRAKFVVGSGHAAVLGARTEDAPKSRGGSHESRKFDRLRLGRSAGRHFGELECLGAADACIGGPAYKVTPLLKGPGTGDPSKETVMIRVDWPPNVSTGRHTHPGDEYGTVLEGTLISQDEGGEWKTYNAGDSYHKVTGVVHETKSGDQSAKSLNVFVVEKGKPMVQPASK